jgi:hypothetical protein
MYTLLKFFHAVGQGKLNSFRFKDWSDYSMTTAEGILGTGVGTGYPTYQLRKRYSAGSNNRDRDIKKPVAATYSVYRAAVLQTAGGSPGNYALSTITGIVTFVADDSEAISTHTPGASHIFTTAADMTMLAIGEKVYITGVAGTGATTLNGIAHTISNKTGAGPYTWTISTNTTGLTTSSGTAYAYPQAGEALTAASEFDQPVRFDVDHLDSVIDSFGTRTWSNVALIEVKV